MQGLTVPCENRKSSIYQLGLGPRIRSFPRYSKYKGLEYRESEAFIIAEGWRDKGQEASMQMVVRIHMGAASDCMSSSTSACNCLQSHLASVSPLPSKLSVHFLVDRRESRVTHGGDFGKCRLSFSSSTQDKPPKEKLVMPT